MKHKQVEVIGYEFDSLPAHVRITGRGSGATLRVALQRAVANMFTKQNLRRKHLDAFKLAVVVIAEREPPVAVRCRGIALAALRRDARVSPADTVTEVLTKAGNCGDCLMEHAEIVRLRDDRTCACCDSGHKLRGTPVQP